MTRDSASLCPAGGIAGNRGTAVPGPSPADPDDHMPDDALCSHAPRSRPPESTAPGLAELERRYDGPIPRRELDAARYPTLARQIVRARARHSAARAAAAEHIAQWRRELILARARAPNAADFAAAVAAARRVHAPHLRYHLREARNWAAHLAELEDRQRARHGERIATAESAR